MGLLGPFDGHPDLLEQGLRLDVRLAPRRVALGGPRSLQGGRWTWLPGCIATRRHAHVCRGPARRGSGNPGPNCRRAASIVSNTDLKVSALAEPMSVLPPISSFCLPTGSGQLQGQTSPWPVPRVPNGRCLCRAGRRRGGAACGTGEGLGLIGGRLTRARGVGSVDDPGREGPGWQEKKRCKARALDRHKGAPRPGAAASHNTCLSAGCWLIRQGRVVSVRVPLTALVKRYSRCGAPKTWGHRFAAAICTCNVTRRGTRPPRYACRHTERDKS